MDEIKPQLETYIMSVEDYAYSTPQHVYLLTEALRVSVHERHRLQALNAEMLEALKALLASEEARPIAHSRARCQAKEAIAKAEVKK